MPVSSETIKAVRFLMALEKRWEQAKEAIEDTIEELTSDLSDKETQDLFDMLVKEGTNK